jgi:MFS family permease
MLESESNLAASGERLDSTGRAFEALAHREFRVYWLGQTISLVGVWMQSAALGWVVVGLTGEATKIAAVYFASSVPVVLLSPYGGVLADRHPRRKLLLGSYAALAALALAVAALLATERLTLTLVYALAAAWGMVAAVERPAQRAFLPQLVPARCIPPAVGLQDATFHGSRVVGPALAGMLMAAVSATAVFVVNALSYLGVITSLLLVRPRQSARPNQRGLVALREGLVYVARRREVLFVLGFVGLTTCCVFPCLTVFTPLVVKYLFQGDAAALGCLLAASGFGATVGSLLMIKVPAAWRGRAMLGGALVAGLMLIWVSTLRSPWPALAVIGTMTLSVSLALGLCVTVLQLIVPEALLGRVMALHSLLFAGLMPTAALVWGAVMQAVGLAPGLRFMGVGYLALAIPWLVGSGMWRPGPRRLGARDRDG